MEYVVGLIFSECNPNRLLMIRKNRPDWQSGKLNGIGGKIEKNESADQAMTRECNEECDLDIDPWHYLGMTEFANGETVYYYAAEANLNKAKSMTDEPLETITVKPGRAPTEGMRGPNQSQGIFRPDMVYNMPWVIMFAQNRILKNEFSTFQLQEFKSKR